MKLMSKSMIINLIHYLFRGIYYVNILLTTITNTSTLASTATWDSTDSLFKVTGEPAAVKEFDRVANISEDVIRHIVVRVEE